MNILVIDDKKEEVQGIIDHFTEQKDCCDFQFDFKKGEEKLRVSNSNIDLIVLDLHSAFFDGTDKPGEGIFDELWSYCFVPTVIFSAYADAIPQRKHKFVGYFKKTDENKVIEFIEKFKKEDLERVRGIRRRINRLLKVGLEAEDNKISESENSYKAALYLNYGILEDALNLSKNTAMPASVQLILLPDYGFLFTCDVLQSMTDPSHFVMVFTPDCDIAKDNLPVVLCKELDNSTFCKTEGLNDGGRVSEGRIFLPNNPYFSSTFVNCNKPEIVPKDQISIHPNETDSVKFRYKKILSIASPFKERIIRLNSDHDSRIGVPSIARESWFHQ
jgi:hypothetical protein